MFKSMLPIPRRKLIMFVAVFVVAVSAASVVLSSAAASAYVCQPGLCKWGYNYVGYGVNQSNYGGWNYWTVQYLDKNSGDWVQVGTGPVDGCDVNKTGSGTWSWGLNPDCGSPSGYMRPYHIWTSGNTSYLYTQVTTGL